TCLGNIEEARAAATDSVAITAELSGESARLPGRGVLGFLELSLSNFVEAADHLDATVASLTEQGWRDPADLRPNAIEALVAVGDLDRASELLRDLQDWADELDAPVAQASAGRCHGLLCAARGDIDGALVAFAEALRVLEHLPAPLDRGRTLLALGSLQRRLRRRTDARNSLDAARAIFEKLGARLWTERTHVELAQLGGRPRHDGKLTATEQRIAALVARGRSNQQVADALFISPKTV